MELSKLTMYEACLLHSRAERVLKGLVSRHLEDWGITRMEWLLLATAASCKDNEQGSTMGEIAEILDIRLSQLTALSSNMTREGLLNQTVSPKDRRTKYLKITSRGLRFLADIEQDMRHSMRQWLAEIPREQLAIYMNTVRELGSDSRLR